MPKFCRDCHHARNRQADQESWKCAAPENVSDLGISLITGEPFPKYPTAYIARCTSVNSCGEAARWFKTKEQVFAEHSKKLADLQIAERKDIKSKIALGDI